MADDIANTPQMPQGDASAPNLLDKAYNKAFSGVSPDQAYGKAFSPENLGLAAPAEPTEISTPQQKPQSGPVNVINPEGKLVSIPGETLPHALELGYKPATDEHVKAYMKDQKYGTPLEQAKTFGEAAARNATFGLSTGLETALGVNPEDIRGREETNPTTSTIGGLTGLAGSLFIPGAGEANILKAVGEGAAEAVGLGAAKAGFLNQIGHEAVNSAFQAGLYQGGEEVHKAFSQDPQQSAETAIADMGLATVMGGVFGGALGAAAAKLKGPKSTFVSELDRPAVEAGDFKAGVKASNIIPEEQKQGILSGLGKEKANAKEIKSAAERIGSPVMEGMISDSKLVQKAEDTLINGAPTYVGVKRQELYNKAYQASANAIEDSLGAGSQLSKAELGNEFKDSIVKQLKEQNAPIAEMYEQLKQQSQNIELPKNAISNLVDDLNSIKEFKISPTSPEGTLVKRVISDANNLKTVDDVKIARGILGRSLSPTSPSGEKRMVGILLDKLNDLEEKSIESAAKKSLDPQMFANWIQQKEAANEAYKPFIGKVKTLLEQLGKGRVYGAQDAIHFIQDRLTPEEVTQRLFSKNNSEFIKFFAKEFPQQMEQMRAYQKGALRETASKSGELSPKVLFNNVNKLEPEIQKSLFNKAELQKLQDAETVIRSFPERFNPSGTSHTSAFREFFNSPTGSVLANARDFGIEKFIQAVSASPDVQNASTLAKATVKGAKSLKNGVSAIFNAEKPSPAAITAEVSEKQRDKLNKLVLDYVKNPNKLEDLGANNPVPVYNAAFAQTSARALQYLNSMRPNTDKLAPLDAARKPSSEEKAKYNTALDIAQNPFSVLESIKNGSITPEKIQALTNIYPSLYKKMSENLTQEMTEQVDKGKLIPYQTRLGLSMFLGHPLDSTMTPVAIVGAQPLPTQQNAPQTMPGPKKGTATLSKVPGQYQTPEQARAARQNKQ